MGFKSNTLVREKKTLSAMISMYCRGRHKTGGRLCYECRQLLQYATERLDKCPFGIDKGPCSQCEIHCYKPEMRKRIREVMRYAGPRMPAKHPVLAIDHLIKKLRHKSPDKRQ